MRELIRQGLRNLVTWLVEGSRWAARYRLRLVAMLVAVFLGFSYALVHIIKAQGSEPITLELDGSSWLGVLVSSSVFQKIMRVLVSPWNLGPSSETLLGLMLLTFFILVCLVLVSHYVRLFFIPLSIVTTVIFWQLFSILKRHYYIDNVVELFDHWGLKIRRNIDPLGLRDPDRIDATVNLVYDTYTYVLKSQGQAYAVTGFDRVRLREEIMGQSFDSWKAVEIFIKERLVECIEIINPSATSFFSGFSVSGVAVTLIAVVVLIVLASVLFGVAVDYTASVSKAQDSLIKLNEVTENKVNTIYEGTRATLAFTEESGQIHQSQADVSEKIMEGALINNESIQLLNDQLRHHETAQRIIINNCKDMEARLSVLESQPSVPSDFSYTVIADGSAALASQIQGIESCAQYIVSGDTGSVVVYLLDLSRAQGIIPAERLGTIKTAADAIFAIVRGNKD